MTTSEQQPPDDVPEPVMKFIQEWAARVDEKKAHADAVKERSKELAGRIQEAEEALVDAMMTNEIDHIALPTGKILHVEHRLKQIKKKKSTTADD